MPTLPGSDASPDDDDDLLNATERLHEGWEPAPIPVGPDGMPAIERKLLTPLPVASNPSPTLCEIGPCENYHRLVVQLDSAQPTDGTLGDLHGEVIRTCYPAPGREFALDGTPVWECNRWVDSSLRSHDARTAFPDVLAKWKADRRAEQEAEQAELERIIADQEPEPAPAPLPGKPVAPEPVAPTIILNGVAKTLYSSRMSYDALVALAGMEGRPTVAWSLCLIDGSRGGTLNFGYAPLEIFDGMVINITHT